MPAADGDAPPQITEADLVKAACGVLRKRNQKAKSYFATVSHYNLQQLGLRSLAGIEAATGARVLYVYDNHIPSLAPLARLRLLTQLYAENNALTGLEIVPAESGVAGDAPAPPATPSSASSLLGSAAPPPPPQHVPLEKAFLKGNLVARVSVAAARALPALRELHLGSQRLGGAALAFEPGALRVWGRAGLLRVLDVSHCGLPSLAPLAPLRCLEALRAGGNPVPRVEDAAALLGALPALSELDVRGCDFAVPGANGLPQGRYRDALVRAAGPRLALLDGGEVTDAHRAFLEGKAAAAAHLVRAGGGAGDAAAAAAAYRAARAVAAALAEEAAPRAAAVAPPPPPPPSLPAWDADGGPLPEEDGGERSAEEDGGGGGGEGGGGGLGDTLVPAQAAAVRRASLAGEGNGGGAGRPPAAPPRAPPPPPPPPAAPRSTEGASGFFSISKNPPVEPHMEALSPRRTPTDFTAHSRFVGGFSTSPDRESARMHREREKELAKIEAMRRTGRRVV
jgi:hypothetical protein